MHHNDDWSVANPRWRARVENPDRAVYLWRAVRVPKETGTIAKKRLTYRWCLIDIRLVRRSARIHQLKDFFEPGDDVAGFQELLPLFDADGQQRSKCVGQ